MQNKQMTEWEKLALKIENEEWRDKAASIAITVLMLLDRQKMTKQQLAEKMGVKPQYVSRVVKGHANLTLDTIAKLEKALGTPIISVYDPSAVVLATAARIDLSTNWRSFFQTTIKGSFTTTSSKRQPKLVYSSNDNSIASVS